MILALTLVAALLLDRAFGEPRQWHPLVGFGRLAAAAEALLHPGENAPADRGRHRGTLALAGLVVPPVLVASALQALPLLGWPIAGGLLYLTLGGTSLGQHARAVQHALEAGDLPRARRAVSRIVSRDTRALEETAVVTATVESVLENGSDAVFGALFWFAVLGAPGAVGYRLVNTLDAMWGYRNARYADFGRAAARADDLLNWIPARLTALAYAAAGRTGTAWRCWHTQAGAWKSPNAGTVMAAGAGALQVRLGGGATYAGRWQERPALGAGPSPVAADIGRALGLVDRALLVWLAGILLLVWLGP